MRILHLLPSDKYSGAENVVCQIISFFRNDKNFEMIYCSPDGDIRTALLDRGVSFSPVKEFSALAIKKKIKEIQPDIIHAHDMKASVIAAFVAGHTPIVSHIHVNNCDTRGISIKAVLFYFAAIKARHIFWVSRSSYEEYLFHKSLKWKSEILMNIINIQDLQIKADEDNKQYPYDIVYLGRLSAQKNPIRLMKIVHGIVQKYPKVRVAVIGNGDLFDEVNVKAKEYKIDSNIDFLGFIRNPYKIVQNAKLMLMTSLWEGTPMCALEAMSLGVPIVSTPVDGMCDLVENGKTGILSDNDEALVDACYNIIINTKYQHNLSVASFNRAKSIMNIDIYKARIMKVYQDIIYS